MNESYDGARILAILILLVISNSYSRPLPWASELLMFRFGISRGLTVAQISGASATGLSSFVWFLSVFSASSSVSNERVQTSSRINPNHGPALVVRIPNQKHPLFQSVQSIEIETQNDQP